MATVATVVMVANGERLDEGRLRDRLKLPCGAESSLRWFALIFALVKGWLQNTGQAQ